MKSMNLVKSCVLFCLLVWSMASLAQQTHPWDKYLDELTSSEALDIETTEDIYDVLSRLYAHPLDINTASRENLSPIPFLSAQQLQHI